MPGPIWGTSTPTTSPIPATTGKGPTWGTTTPAALTAPSTGGGGGGILGSVEHGLTSAAHVAESVGTGIYEYGKAAVAPGTHPSWGTLGHEFVHPETWLSSKSINADPLAKQTVAQVAPLAHPLRDPVSTALAVGFLVLPAAGSAVARGAYLAKIGSAARVSDEAGSLVVEGSQAADAAEAAGHTVTPLSSAEKTALRAKVVNPRYTPPTAPRIIQKPVVNLVKPEGGAEGPAAAVVSHVPVQLTKSGSHLIRNVVQRPLDAAIQRGLDTGVNAAKPSLLTRYATSRVTGSLAEGGRIQHYANSVLGHQLVQEGKNFGKGVSKQEGRLAIFLRSGNVAPDEAASFWTRMADEGTNPGTRKLAATAQSLHDKGVLRIGDSGKLEVNADRFPRLAHVDALAKQAQGVREDVISKHDLMTEAGMTSRKNLVPEMMGSEQARSGVTGAREGDAYISLKTSVPRRGLGGVIRQSRGPVVGATRSFIPKTIHATGTGVAKGLIPENPVAAIARSLHEALKYTHTVDYRKLITSVGSDVRSRGDEVLVREPDAAGVGTVPQSIHELLGTSESTVTEAEHQGLAKGIRAQLEHAIPGLGDNFAADRAAGIGTRAPDGYKWVPHSMLGDLTKVATPRGPIEKFADTLNSAVTAATVYARPGHLLTRALTNATTNLIQGSFAPGELKATAQMVHAMGGLEGRRAQEWAAVTGTHSVQALPAEGMNIVARGARRGAAWWARRVDMPFRLNAVLSELRSIGIDTLPKLDEAMRQIKDPSRAGMSGSEIMKLDGALRRANRTSIMYDGMSEAEKRYIARYVWFFPWVKGGTRYGFHVAAEHPLKAYAITQTGRQGARYQQQQLGTGPPYEFGLTPLTGGSSPLTSNFSSFTPFGQIGSDIQMVQHPFSPDSGVLGQLNPESAAVARAIGDAYTGKSGTQIVRDAAGQAVQPTPEFGAINAYLHPPRPTQMFGATNVGLNAGQRGNALLSQLARALGGPAVPRPTRKAELAKAAAPHHYIRVPG